MSNNLLVFRQCLLISLPFSVWIAPKCWLVVWEGLKAHVPEVWSLRQGGVLGGTTAAYCGEDADFRGPFGGVSRGPEHIGHRQLLVSCSVQVISSGDCALSLSCLPERAAG